MDNYYYKKLKYEYKYNNILKRQKGGSWFNFFKKNQNLKFHLFLNINN